jgi:hypothetical protein
LTAPLGLALADTRTPPEQEKGGVSGALLYVSLSGRRGSSLYLPRLAYTGLTAVQPEPRLSGGVAMANRKGLHFVHRHCGKLYSF